MKSRLATAAPRAHTLRHRLIVALDVDTLAEAESLVTALESEVSFFKVGKRLKELVNG
mgnify:CR=1 FL=1